MVASGCGREPDAWRRRAVLPTNVGHKNDGLRHLAKYRFLPGRRLDHTIGTIWATTPTSELTVFRIRVRSLSPSNAAFTAVVPAIRADSLAFNRSAMACRVALPNASRA